MKVSHIQTNKQKQKLLTENFFSVLSSVLTRAENILFLFAMRSFFLLAFSFFFNGSETYESVPCDDGRRCRRRQSVFKLHKVRSDSDVKETGN